MFVFSHIRDLTRLTARIIATLSRVMVRLVSPKYLSIFWKSSDFDKKLKKVHINLIESQ